MPLLATAAAIDHDDIAVDPDWKPKSLTWMLLPVLPYPPKGSMNINKLAAGRVGAQWLQGIVGN